MTWTTNQPHIRPPVSDHDGLRFAKPVSLWTLGLFMVAVIGIIGVAIERTSQDDPFQEAQRNLAELRQINETLRVRNLENQDEIKLLRGEIARLQGPQPK